LSKQALASLINGEQIDRSLPKKASPKNGIAYERFGTYFAKGAVWQADICHHMLNGPVAGRA
jgi:hypothetical protein